jgi:hypothetical protein
MDLASPKAGSREMKGKVRDVPEDQKDGMGQIVYQPGAAAASRAAADRACFSRIA